MKPDYPKHRKTRAVCRDARLLNIHLWNLADDEGRLQELPQWIIGEVFPTDEDVTPGVLRDWLGSLQSAGLIQRYEVSGERYIQCHDFSEHQVINRPRPSVIPAPDAGILLSPTAHGGLHEDSLPEKEEEGKGKGKRSVADRATPLSHLLAELIVSNGSRKPTIGQGWKDAERLLIDTDGRDPSEAERLIRWCQADDFWRANVLSMPKFREKYDQLLQNAKRGIKAKSPGMAQAHRFAEMARQAEAEEQQEQVA